MSAIPTSEKTLQEAVDALEFYGTQQAAAQALNISRSTLQGRLMNATIRGIVSTEKKLQVKQGYSPEYDLTHPIPQPMILGAFTNQYNGKTGELERQWIKGKMDQMQQEAAMRAAIEALAEQVPRAEPSARPNHTSEHLCNLYTLTDCHVGMKAWGVETGTDWDLELAERTLIGAFDYLVEACPPAKVGIVLNLGDFLHYDSLTAVTPTNQHPLDADSRYSKMVKVAIKILRYIINRALTKHDEVLVVMSEGNHDPASSVWLRHLFSLLYENEPRVKVLDSEMVYTVYQHGKTMLAFHHGHIAKKEQLPLLFAAQYPVEWGSSTRRYCHVGHMHHVDEKEHAGMTVRQHATLAARDAYAARGGWVSERQIEAITYHTEYGKVASTTVVPNMLS